MSKQHWKMAVKSVEEIGKSKSKDRIRISDEYDSVDGYFNQNSAAIRYVNRNQPQICTDDGEKRFKNEYNKQMLESISVQEKKVYTRYQESAGDALGSFYSCEPLQQVQTRMARLKIAENRSTGFYDSGMVEADGAMSPVIHVPDLTWDETANENPFVRTLDSRDWHYEGKTGNNRCQEFSTSPYDEERSLWHQPGSFIEHKELSISDSNYDTLEDQPSVDPNGNNLDCPSWRISNANHKAFESQTSITNQSLDQMERKKSLIGTWNSDLLSDSSFEIKEPQLLDPDKYNWRLSVTLLLFKVCLDGYSYRDTNFHCVIISDLEEFAMILIELVVSYQYLDVKNRNGQSVLHLAVIQNMPGLVRRILAHGATPDVRDNHGNTALHVAVTKGHLTCVEALTKHLTYEDVKDIPYSVPFKLIPQNFGIMNAEGETVIHLAVKNLHTGINIVRYLVKDMYANVNIQEGKLGKTALHMAVELENIEMIEFLVEQCEANVNVITYDRRTPFDFALDKKNKEICDYLWSKGGRYRDMDGYSDDEDDEDDDDDDDYLVHNFEKVINLANSR